MRFHSQFTRNKGGGAPALGSDLDPNVSFPEGPHPTQDNVLSANIKSSWNEAVKRIAIAYHPPAGALALDAQVWIWDGLTKRWYKLLGGGAGKIVADTLSFFDLPPLSDRLMQLGAESQSYGAGFDVYIQITDPGAAPAGAHIFAVGAMVGQYGIA